MHPTPLHDNPQAPSTPLQKLAADRFEIDLTEPLRHNPAALPRSHPSSPVAKPPLFSDPKVAQALLVDYVAGFTASRLCSNYNISLPQLFAWRRAPETEALLTEHEEFAAAQTRQVQHDKEPEIILTLCAIATRGSNESESRRAASDLLRAFKFRDYLALRRPRKLETASETPTENTPDNDPDNQPPLGKSTHPRPPRDCTPSTPRLSLSSPSNRSQALRSSAGMCPLPSPKGCGQASSRSHAEAMTVGALKLPAATSPSSNPQALPTDTGPVTEPDTQPNSEPDTDPDDEELLENELDQDELDAADDDLEEDELETPHELDNSDENARGKHNDQNDDDDDDDDARDEGANERANECADEGENKNSPKSAVPNPNSEMPFRSALRAPSSALPPSSHIEQEILTQPAEVSSHSRPAPDPAPGFPFCLDPKPSGAAPSFEEMTRFMSPPSKSFNPFWSESDILYLCYPGRTDKHNLRSAIVSHQEMLARSGAQALVDRNHFPPEQQSYQAYCAAEDFYKQLARKNPPPDH